MQTRMRAALAAATRTARPCRAVVAAAATRTTFLSSSLCCARRACATRAQARPCHRVSTTTTPPTTTNATADTVASTDERADALLRALRSARATHADDAVRVCAYASGVVAIEVRNDGAQTTTTTTTTTTATTSSWLRVAHACVRGGQQRLLLHRLLFALSVSPTSARITDDNDNNDDVDDTRANGDRDDDNMMTAATTTAAAAASPVANARGRTRHAASQRSRHDGHRVQHALLQCARALLARVRPTASLHYTHETVRRPHQHPSVATSSSSQLLDDEAARVHVVRIHIVQNDSACRATASRQQQSSSTETTIWGKNTHRVHAQAAAMCLGSALFRALYIAFAQLDVHFTYTPPAAAQLQLSQAHSTHHHNSHHHNDNDNAACHVHINDAADETVVSMLDAYRRVLRACCASYAVLVEPLPPERASATTNGDNNNNNNSSSNNNSDGARDEDGDATAVVRVRVLRDGAEVLASVSGPQTTLLALLLRAYATAARYVDAVRCDAAQRRIAGDPLLFARSARPSASHTTITPLSSSTSTAASSSRHTNHDMASTRQMMRRALLQLLLYYYDVPYRAVDMMVSDSAYSTYACRVCVRVPRVYERYSSGRRVDNNNSSNNNNNNNNSNDDKDAVLCVELAHAGAYDKRMAKEVACLRAVTRHFRRVYDEQLRDDAAVQALLRSHDARASDAAGGGVPCPPVSVGVSMVLLWVLQRSGRRHHLVSHYVPYHRLARTAAASAHGLQAHASLLSNNNNNSNSNDNNSNNDDNADTTSEAALAAAEAAVTWTEQFCLVLWIATLHICAADTSTSSSSEAAALTTPTRAHGKAAAATVSSLHDAIVTRPNGDVVVTAVDVTRARCERKAMAMFLAHHDRALCRDVLHAAVTCGMLHRDGSPCVVTTTAPTANARATFAAADVVATAAADAADDADTTTQAPLRTYDVAALLTSPHRAQLQRVRGGAVGAVSVLSMCRAALHAYARDYDTTRQQRSSAREDKDSSHKDDNNNDDEKAAATSTLMTWLVDEAVRSCVDDAACANDAAPPPPRQRDATRVQCVYDATLRLVATDADGGEWATTTLSHARAASRPAALLAAYMAFARRYLDDNKNDNRNNNNDDDNNNDNKEASACRRERMGAQSEVAESLRAAEWLLASQPTSLRTAAPLTSLAQHAMSCFGLQTYVYMEHLPHVCTVAVYGVDEGDDDAADTDGGDDTNTAESEHDDNDGNNEDDTSNNKSKSSSDDHNDGADTVPLIERRHARMGRKNVYCTHTTRDGARRRVYHSDVCERATFAVRCTHARPDKALSQCIHDAFARLTVDTTATTTRRRDIAASSSSTTTTSPATSDEGVVLRFKAASVLGVLCRAVMHDVNTHYASSMRATQRSTTLHDGTHGRTHARDNNDNNNNNNNTTMYKGSVRVQTHAGAADASRAVVAVVVALDAHPRDATAGLSCVRLERVEAASVLLALRELCTRIRDELGAGHAAVREAARLAATATATATPPSSAMHMAGLRPSQLLLQQVTQRLATLYGLTMTMRESYSECDRQWQCSIAVALDAQHECVVMTAKSSRKRAAQWQAMHNLLHTHLSYDVAPTTTSTTTTTTATTTRSATNTTTTRNATGSATTTTTTCADETRQHAYADEEEQQQQSSSFVLTGEAEADARSVLDATLEDLSA